MALVDINLQPSDRVLRQFGWIALGGSGLLALAAWQQFGWLGRVLGSVGGAWLQLALIGVGAMSAVFSLALPRANLPLYATLVVITAPIGLVVSYVLMAALFYLVVAPTGLLMRLLGRDPLQRAWREGGTYWEPARGGRAKESYFKQF